VRAGVGSEMLEALETALIELQAVSKIRMIDEEIDQIEAVLAKARGES